MSKRTTLKTLIVYLLISCFLVSNLAYTASSEASNSGAYENDTQLSGSDVQINPKINPSENINKENPDGESSAPPADAENGESGNTGRENPEKPDNSQIEGTEPKNADEIAESTNETPGYPENGGTGYEGTDPAYENRSSETAETETLNNTEFEDAVPIETEISEDIENDSELEPLDQTETRSSHHRSSGNSGYKIIKTKPAVKNEVDVPEPVPTPDFSKALQEVPPSASVNLHGEKTDVIAGEDILLKLSAVNLITKPLMHVQVIIIPPSGMSVSSSEFVQSGAGQYTTTYELEPGQGRDIEVRIESYQPGEFNVKGRVVYYFGENIKNAEDYTLELPIKVRDKSYLSEKTMPGFGMINIIFAALGIFILRRHKI